MQTVKQENVDLIKRKSKQQQQQQQQYHPHIFCWHLSFFSPYSHFVQQA